MEENSMYICPVCGYTGLYEQPYDKNGCASYEICPCCGFEFGYDDNDQGKTFKQYREKWILNGASWFNEKRKPEKWNLKEQLKNLKE
jgi:transcription initiation factor IIE alpha subunit